MSGYIPENFLKWCFVAPLYN